MLKPGENVVDVMLRAIKEGREFVFISEIEDTQLLVTGNGSPEWVAKVLDAVRETIPEIKDVPGHQVKIVEIN